MRITLRHNLNLPDQSLVERGNISSLPRQVSNLFSKRPEKLSLDNTSFLAIAADTAMSSSRAFGTIVHEMVRDAQPRRQNHGAHNTTTYKPQGCIPAAQIPGLPSEEEACRLLNTVSFYVGQTQSHFSAIELADCMGILYTETFIMPSDLQFLAVIIVLALGKLLDARLEATDDGFPGTELFQYAYANLPSLGAHFGQGRLAIEVYALSALFLQMINRNDEAYVHVSSRGRMQIRLC